MAPRPTAHQASPATLVADAISSLQKAVGNALASVNDQGKAELARAREETEGARREKDDALKQMHAAKLACKEWERRGEVWKAASEKSEMTITHQAETIAQLREEAQQWKNQLLRYEETSRREIQDWKEQYSRAEHERSRLSSRLDQLIAEQVEVSSTRIESGKRSFYLCP
ncbi:hypothetical protein PHLGIDRAFT_306989 [Phlebiopsis gigantea 11061_1 CR5-6]|uniref:Uncharacterized protein n=1 Tax=Phlebiopsis gigantea (strain 11061_1 CR5-6) TaxID=745531 RepID=A0A0C3S2Q6_PHLG1|nr:hypothetical protein PHLGIDRAFT_306989 [Phlebiopsis gigantea 11061_1 CR5-6]